MEIVSPTKKKKWLCEVSVIQTFELFQNHFASDCTDLTLLILVFCLFSLLFFNDFIVFRVICHPVMMISCLSADILNIPFASICVHLKSIFTSIQFLFCFLLICSRSAFNCIHFSSLPSAVSGHISLVCLPVFTIAQSFFYLFL